MRITIIAMLATGLLGLSATLFAAGELPSRGMTQDAIRAQFGAPSRQVAPVGSPPISRWIYDDFTVYFEGKFSIHTVSHARTLTTPQAAEAVSAPPAAQQPAVEQLPPIEEISEPGTAVQIEAVAPEQPAAAESTFRFDPASGRIIEIGPDGKPVQSPTSQPGSSPSAPAPAAGKEDSRDSKVVAPAVAPQTAPASAPAKTGTSMRFDPASGRMIEVGPDGTPVQPAEPAPAPAKTAPAEPAATAPAPAAAAEPAPTPAETKPAPAATPAPAAPAEPATGKFRFDPATGRIVMDGAEPSGQPAEPAQPAAEPVAPAEKPAANPTSEPAPRQPAAEEKKPTETAPDDNGFSIQW